MIDFNIKLSENFRLIEFVRSQTAIRLDIDNTPQFPHIHCLRVLCKYTLEPIREYFNKPIIISSGYRSPELNRAIGGAKYSRHIYGKAADFYIHNIPPQEIFNSIIQLQQNNLVDFETLILEFNSWIHISRSTNKYKNTNKILIAEKDQNNLTTYRSA